MMLLETCVPRRFAENPWIRARMVKRWLQMKKEVENSIETRIKTAASDTTSPSQRRTLNVIVVGKRDK